MLHLGVHEWKPSKCRLVHGIYEVLITVGKTSLLAEELPVKVAAVIRRFLEVSTNKSQQNVIIAQELQFLNPQWRVWRTTLGLKGGSTSLISNACQLMLLKKGCNRILPTIPILRVGSLSNNCREGRSERLHKEYDHVSNTKDFQLNGLLMFSDRTSQGLNLVLNVPSTQVHQQANFFTVISYSTDNLSYSGQDSARSYNWQSNCRWSRPY